MKMRVIQQGDKTFDLDSEHAGPAIAAAITGESGEDIRSEIIDYTDTERGDVDRDEYVIVTDDDGGTLWSGWLDSDKDDVPPPASAEPQRAPVVSGPAQLEVSPGRAAYEASLIVIADDLILAPLPWASLPPKHREAWRAAADAALMMADLLVNGPAIANAPVKPVVIVYDPRECTNDYIGEIATAVREQSGGRVVITEVDAQMSDVMIAVADREVGYDEAAKIWHGSDD